MQHNNAEQIADTNADDNSADQYDGMNATYSPEDNKLRLYSESRLDEATYRRAHDLGFRYAPRQGFFVAPMWTPEREDLLLELCGDIDDEAQSLAERAEARSERFSGYQQNRTRDAAAARNAAHAIAEHIPLGQPILIGHHSERRARKDAERIDNNMRRAVKNWETAEYWSHRAGAALAHAEYKSQPDVRYRRIKKIESELRKMNKTISGYVEFIEAWQCEGLTTARALALAAVDRVKAKFTLDKYPRNPPVSQNEDWMTLYDALQEGIIDAEKAREIAVRVHTRSIERPQRWINHYNNRLTYERAMLGESGGIAADKFNIEPGGMVKIGREWSTVVRVTRKNGAIVSVTINCRYVPVRGIEEVRDYREPTDEQRENVAAVTKTKPLANYPAEGFAEITQAQWNAIDKDYKCTRVHAGNEQSGAHRVRYVQNFHLNRQINGGRGERHGFSPVYIKDAKRKDPPPAIDAPAPAPLPREIEQRTPTPAPVPAEDDGLRTSIEQMRGHLKSGGVQVVTAPQLFETPIDLAGRVVDEADPREGLRWLEPSVGTGRLCAAVLDYDPAAELVAVELSPAVAVAFKAKFPGVQLHQRDFLEVSPSETGLFDRVVMNPPFANAIDIKHIQHAATFLKPGGVLVAICAGGPRQIAQLTPWAEASGGFFEPLPTGTFKDAGTNVSSALLVFNQGGAE